MLLYSQIDIPVKLPPEEKLFEFVRTQLLVKDHDIKKGALCFVGAMCELDEWFVCNTSDGSPIVNEETQQKWDEYMPKLARAISSYEVFTENTPTYWNPQFEEWFPELKEAALQLPFDRIVVAFFLFSDPDGEKLHNDGNHIRDSVLPYNPLQPARYNIALNHIDTPEVYINLPDGERQYCKVSKDYPIFVFDDDRFQHAGANVEDGSVRVQLIVRGELNEQKHRELIERSLKKFPDNCRYYP